MHTVVCLNSHKEFAQINIISHHVFFLHEIVQNAIEMYSLHSTITGTDHCFMSLPDYCRNVALISSWKISDGIPRKVGPWYLCKNLLEAALIMSCGTKGHHVVQPLTHSSDSWWNPHLGPSGFTEHSGGRVFSTSEDSVLSVPGISLKLNSSSLE